MTAATDSDREAYFSRLAATYDRAEELADAFGSVGAFLAASFEEKLLAVVGPRQARAIVVEYDDFETLRDEATFPALLALDGVGGTSAGRVDAAYIRRTIHPPRDVLTAEQLAVKMGLVTHEESPDPPQADLRAFTGADRGAPPSAAGASREGRP